MEQQGKNTPFQEQRRWKLTFFSHSSYHNLFLLVAFTNTASTMLSMVNRSRVYYRYARRQVTTAIGEVTTTQSLPIFSLGTFSGVLGSLVGMGGSFIALPFLTGMFRLSQHHAHGTSMAVVLATATGGSLAYIFREGSLLDRITHIDTNNIPTMIGDVHLLTAASVALSSSMTVVLGAKFSKMASAQTLRKIMCSFLFLMAPVVPMRQQIQDFFDGGHHIRNNVTDHATLENLPSRMARPLVIGAFSGILAGMFGVGGGTVTVPSLTIFTDIDHQVALGTSLAGKSSKISLY